MGMISLHMNATQGGAKLHPGAKIHRVQKNRTRVQKYRCKSNVLTNGIAAFLCNKTYCASLAQGLEIKKNAFRNFHFFFLISAASLVYRWGSISKPC